ncbi:TolC family protein [Candidatus Agathobaculum pullicola]|uniref:TolC family protein n=1 Tax=Candidatus Agathobaculum pullicola TaxID=2838426 RepID=UPI003F9305E9
MKRIRTGALLAGALCVLTVVPAGAVGVLDVAGAGIWATVSTVQDVLGRDGVNAAPPVQDEQAIGFVGLEKTVRANNPTIQGFQKTLASIQNTNLDAQFLQQEFQYQAQYGQYKTEYDAYNEFINALGDSQDATVRAQIAMATKLRALAASGMDTMKKMLDGLDQAQEEAEDQLEDTYDSTKRQLDNTANQIVIGAQSAYIGIITTQEGIATLDRNLAALDRQIAVVEKQAEIGMVSQLTLDNLRQTRRATAAQRETLTLMQATTENQLSLLCGNTAATTVKPTALPTVTDTQLSDMNYEEDLKEALDNSYAIWSAQEQAREASNQYEDGQSSTVDAYEAAKLNLEYAEESAENTFRQLYLDVQDKKRLLDEAKAAYDMEKKNFDVDALQYERGMISQLDYLTAQDDLAAKQDAVNTAERDLFTAYNTYDWAKRGYMAGGAV